MKTTFNSLILILLLCSFSTIQAKAKVLLRLNLQKGSVYTMNMQATSDINQEMMGQNMKINQKMEMIFTFKVTDVLPNKNFQIQYTMDRMKMDMDINGNPISVDSQKPDENSPLGPVLKAINEMKITFELTPLGKVLQVGGLDEVAKKIAANPQMAQSMQMFSNQENFRSFAEQTFSYIPENKVGKGDKWSTQFKLPSLMDTNTTMNFEVASVTKDRMELNVSSDVNVQGPIEQNGMKMDMNMTGTQTGTMTIDTSDGWARSSSLNQKFDMKLKLKNPQTGEDMEIPMKVNSITNYTFEKK